MRTYYETTIHEDEKRKIIDEFVDSVYNTKKDIIREHTEDLVNSLLGGFNAYKDLDEFLDNNMGERWEKARQTIIDGGNYGWTMMVKELLRNMEDEIRDLTNI